METLDIVVVVLVVIGALMGWSMLISIDKRVNELCNLIYGLSDRIDSLRRELKR